MKPVATAIAMMFAMGTPNIATAKSKKPRPKYEWGVQYIYTMEEPTTKKWAQFREYKFFNVGDIKERKQYTLGTFGDWTCYIEFSEIRFDTLPDVDEQSSTFGCRNKNGAETSTTMFQQVYKKNTLGLEAGVYGDRDDFHMVTENRNSISISVVTCDDPTKAVMCNSFMRFPPKRILYY